jgi:peroxiredoxin
MKKEAKISKRAPGFSLPATNGQGTEQYEVSLDDYLDQWLVLLFYPRDFSLI